MTSEPDRILWKIMLGRTGFERRQYGDIEPKLQYELLDPETFSDRLDAAGRRADR